MHYLFSQRGNALFLILIAVALFAALSYAVTQAGRGGGGNVNREKLKLLQTQLADYSSAMTQAAMRLRLTGGCSDEQLTFEDNNGTSARGNGGAPYDYTNPLTPADGSCNLFTPAGGNVTPRRLPAELVIPSAACGAACLAPDSWFVSATRIEGVGSDTGDAAGTDLVLWLGRLSREQCISVNNALGIPNPGGEPPQETFDCQGPQFQGVYQDCLDPIGDGVADLRGKFDFCFDWDGPATDAGYLYMHVILPR